MDEIRRQRREMRRGVARAVMIVAAFALASPFAVSAQATQPQRAKRPILLTGVKLSSRPLHETATGGILIPVLPLQQSSDVGGAVHRGVIIEAGLGVDGYELSAGWGRRLKEPDGPAVIGQDIRATAYRKRTSLQEDATYVGGEAGLTFAMVRVSLGAATRVKGPDTADSTIFTFGVGFHIGF